jgi:hypothetical protein
LGENGDGIDVALQDLLQVPEGTGDPEALCNLGHGGLIEVAAGHLLHERMRLKKRNETTAEMPGTDEAEFNGVHGWMS